MTGISGSILGDDDAVLDCADLVFAVTLASPVPLVLGRVKPGDTLSVRRGTGKAVDAYYASDRVGSITHANQQRLVECLASGEQYEAVVLEVEGGRCEVRVQHVAAS